MKIINATFYNFYAPFCILQTGAFCIFQNRCIFNGLYFADDEAEKFFIIGGKKISVKLLVKALHNLLDKFCKAVETPFGRTRIITTVDNNDNAESGVLPYQVMIAAYEFTISFTTLQMEDLRGYEGG